MARNQECRERGIGMAARDARDLVTAVAEKYEPRCSLTLAELTESGLAGLGRAQEKFDPKGDADWETYATWWIRQAITKAIVERGTTPHRSRRSS
jgi:RNA polymerase primary sigma factor